jgi:hypothetical protein
MDSQEQLVSTIVLLMRRELSQLIGKGVWVVVRTQLAGLSSGTVLWFRSQCSIHPINHSQLGR